MVRIRYVKSELNFIQILHFRYEAMPTKTITDVSTTRADTVPEIDLNRLAENNVNMLLDRTTVKATTKAIDPDSIRIAISNGTISAQIRIVLTTKPNQMAVELPFCNLVFIIFSGAVPQFPPYLSSHVLNFLGFSLLQHKCPFCIFCPPF